MVVVVVVVAYLSCAKVGWQWASIKEGFYNITICPGRGFNSSKPAGFSYSTGFNRSEAKEYKADVDVMKRILMLSGFYKVQPFRTSSNKIQTGK